MKKTIFISLFFAISVFNAAYAGGNKGGGGTVTPTATKTSNCSFYLDWGFGTDLLKGSGITNYCGIIPEGTNYLYNDSPTSSTADNSTYYCEVKVNSDDKTYSKTYTWKKGSSMTIPIPSNKAFKITVLYLERWASGCYSWNGTTRIGYSYSGAFTYAEASIFAKMKYSGKSY
jgi:hypothetical protein